MLAHMSELRGVFAAAVTPLLDGGTRLDEPGIGHMADFLAIASDVRAPLRTLDEQERGELEQALRGLLEAVPA